jgi:hypothetical protein
MFSFCKRYTVAQFILFDVNSFSFSPLNTYKLSQHQGWCLSYKVVVVVVVVMMMVE